MHRFEVDSPPRIADNLHVAAYSAVVVALR
jgi:hypothetical protein